VPGSIVVDNNLRAAASEASAITEVTDASTLDGREINKGGRPKGSTVRARMEADKQLCAAIKFAATEILKEQNAAKSTSTKLAKGRIKTIIAKAHEQCALKDHVNMPRETAMSRVKRDNAKGWQGNAKTTTPMHNVEPILAALVTKLV